MMCHILQTNLTYLPHSAPLTLQSDVSAHTNHSSLLRLPPEPAVSRHVLRCDFHHQPVLRTHRNRAQCYLLDALAAFSQPVRRQTPLDPPDNYRSIEAFRTLHIPGLLCSRSPPAICFPQTRSEHTSELQSLMRISYAVFCLKKKKNYKTR